MKRLTHKERRTILKQIVNDPLLWNIVTALRGPDNEDPQVKDYTTARIRSVVGMRDYDGWDIRSIPLSDFEQRDRERLLKPLRITHFATHYRTAVAAIKLVYACDLETERRVSKKERDVLEIYNVD